MKKFYAKMLDGEIIGLTHTDLQPSFVTSQAEQGVTYEEIEDETMLVQYLERKLSPRDVIKDAFGKVIRNEARLAQKADIALSPTTEEVLAAVVAEDKAELAQLKARSDKAKEARGKL